MDVYKYIFTLQIQEAKPSPGGSSLDKLLEKKVAQSSRNKRKASKPQQLPSFLKVASDDDTEVLWIWLE